MHLKRYFFEFGQEDNVLRDEVFIITEEQWEELMWPGQGEIIPRPWEYFASAKSIVLLGPPRQGKTSEFRHQCSKAQNGFFLSLSKVPTRGEGESFQNTIENYLEWAAWLGESAEGELFIDALDEAKLSTRKMIQDLIAWLRGMGEPVLKRLRIHLSCRMADWDRADQDDWVNFFQFPGEASVHRTVVILSLLDLSRSQYNEYCQGKDVDPDQLLQDLPPRARRFVARPQTLAMLVEDYRQSHKVPDNIRDLYEKVIQRRLDEENQWYLRDVRSIPNLKKRDVADRYGAITILSDRPLISNQTTELQLITPFGLSQDSVDTEEATFSSGLFRALIRGQYLFDDPGLTEYLGASYLNELMSKGVISANKVFNLFIANPKDEEPVPKLRGLMVWLCALNQAFRQKTIKTNPGVLLDDFPAELNSDDKLAIWDWLEGRYGGRVFFEQSRRWEEGCKVLACPEIVPRLKKCLGNPAYGRDFRILALEVAFAGSLTELGPIIEQGCQNTGDEDHYLIRASQVLSTLAPERSGVLRLWLRLKPEEDPHNYLLGSALQALWPNFITIEEAAACLRPAYQCNGSSDGLFFFLQDLPPKLNHEECKVVINSLAKDLESFIGKDQTAGEELHYGRTVPASHIIYFLLPQIKVWKADSDHLSELENWLSITFRARDKYGLFIHDPRGKLAKIIEEDKVFRHALAVKNIERLYLEMGDGFDVRKYFRSSYLPLKPEDLPLWQETMQDWLGRDRRLIDVVFHQLLLAWDCANNPAYIINWFEKLSTRDKIINQLWSQSNYCTLPDDEDYRQREKLERKKEQEARQQERTQYLLERKTEICAGNPYLLDHLLRISMDNTKSIVEEYGPEIDLAYKIGLMTYWKEKTLPPLNEYYNQFHSAPFFILEAIKFWTQQEKESWADLSDQMCHSALQAGLSKLNQLPEWYGELALFKADTFRDIAFEALKIEAQSSSDYPSLARNLKHNCSNKIFREIAHNFLKLNPDIPPQMALPLAEAQVVDIPDEGAIDFLWELGRHRMNEDNQTTGLSILALVWRYRPETMWDWLNRNFFVEGGKRSERFETWMNAISNVHISHGLAKWPNWVTPPALIALLPDLFINYPPGTDPSIDEFNQNIPAITQRWDFGHLRNDALAKLAESGTTEAGQFLTAWCSDITRQANRDIILLYLDRWHEACAQKGWQPLPPQDLINVLTKGLRPVRNHSELNLLISEIMEDIRAEMEGGQKNLKRLCWIHQRGEAPKPVEESSLQVLLFSEVLSHPLRSKVVGNREVTVTDENHPDIKVETWLEAGQRAMTYIEIKRQMHRDIFESIKDQLADKYLIVPEARYGFYLVGWFGDSSEYWTASQKKRRGLCGGLPANPKELEACLQRLADAVVKERDDIDGIKVIVVDLSH